jgi:hypothetical protein
MSLHDSRGVRTHTCRPRPPPASCTCVSRIHAYIHTHIHPSAGSVRLSLGIVQDNFEHKDMAAAIMKYETRHTRRLDLRKFQASARDMSRGLDLRLSEANIKDLFSQADSDKVFFYL